MSIDTQQEQEAKVRKDLNLHSASHTDAAGASNRPHPENPAHPGHPASDKRDIKVLTDLFSFLPRRFL